MPVLLVGVGDWHLLDGRERCPAEVIDELRADRHMSRFRQLGPRRERALQGVMLRCEPTVPDPAQFRGVVEDVVVADLQAVVLCEMVGQPSRHKRLRFFQDFTWEKRPLRVNRIINEK